LDGWSIATIGSLAVVLTFLAFQLGSRTIDKFRIRSAQDEFHKKRTYFQSVFFETMAVSGKPRGLRWMECQWDESVRYLPISRGHPLTAVIGVCIRFESEVDGAMEDVPAVNQEKYGCALFHFLDRKWHTGRVLFNLSPNQVPDALSDFAN